MTRNGRLSRLILFSMYGAMMFISKYIMEGLPNIHPVTMFIMVFASVYGFKALIPVYIYVLLNGIFAGFNLWWIPYTYIWALQCLIVLLLPRSMSKTASMIAYPAIGAVLGLTYGTMYAPAQALIMGFNFKTTLQWIASGFYFDIIHAVGNVFMGLLVYPLSRCLIGLHRSTRIPQ